MSHDEIDASGNEVGAQRRDELRGHAGDAARAPGAGVDASMKAPARSVVTDRASDDTHGPVLGSVGDRPPPRRSLSSDDRKLLVGSLGVLLAVFALVSSNVAANHSPKPHGLPIGIVGAPAVAGVAGAELARAAPGAFDVHVYGSLTSARTAVLHRSVYGAFEPVPAPVLLVASAASPPVAALLRRTFSGRPAGRVGLWPPTIWCPCRHPTPVGPQASLSS